MPSPEEMEEDIERSAEEEARRLEDLAKPTDAGGETLDDELEVEIGAKDEEGGDELGEEPGDTRSRKQKKRDRFAELKAERDAEREERRKLAERLEAAERRMQSYPDPQTLQQQLLSRQQQQEPEDPHRDELDDVYRQQEMLFGAYERDQQAHALTPDKVQEYQNRARQLEERKAELQYLRAAKRHGMTGQQTDPRAAAREVVQQQIRSEHADIASRQDAWGWATARYQQLRYQGLPDSMDTLNQVMDEARSQFGLPPKRGRAQPTASQRAKYTGMAKGGGSGEKQKGKGRIRMTREYKEMADAMYPEIEDDRERYQKWANEVGPSLSGVE